MDILKGLRSWLNGPEISIFYKFEKPPYGGGNQFLLALTKELKSRSVDIGNNTVGPNTKSVLFNSFNFNLKKLTEDYRHFRPRMVHRLAGPIGLYRGGDTEIDRTTLKYNQEFADATILQSEYSFNAYKSLGMELKNPTIIHNAADPDIFNPIGRISPPNGTRRVRLIATAWSDNVKKGGPLLSWLDAHLDHSRYELTFVGRTKAEFKGARVIEPVPSEQLADILRQNDIYIAPSQDDPCSNALIEALACGLPAVFLKSGGHPELVKAGGEGFSGEKDVLFAIDNMAANLFSYQAKIAIATLKETADKYLEVFFQR